MKLAIGLVIVIVSISARGAKLNCRPEFTRLSALVGESEAARAIGMRSLIENGVEAEFKRLKADPKNASFSDHNLRAAATDRVRERLSEADKPRFDKADLEIKGQKDFVRVLDIFNNPSKYIGGEGTETSPLEDRLLSAAALKFVTRKGTGTANASHLADHVAAVQDAKVAEMLKSMGLRQDALVRNILTHDLGKEYDQLPPHFRAFLESIYPLPKAGEKDVNFLPRVIMSHEFGSMIVAEQLAREAGIPEAKIPRLLALFAHHNAGYDPKLPGFHFWVQPFAWKAFADAMNTRGLNVPTTYDALLGTSKGGSPETIVLTAIDRATSLTLASQEKFTPAQVTQGKFNNEGLGAMFFSNAQNVGVEVRDVLAKLEGSSETEIARHRDLQRAILKFYEVDTLRLSKLAHDLPRMAKGEGSYSDRPATTEEELKTSVIYKTKDGTWHRVTADGKLYQTTTGDWGQPTFTPARGQTPDPAGLLFRRVINPEYGYTPKSLPADLIK